MLEKGLILAGRDAGILNKALAEIKDNAMRMQ